MKVKSLTKAIVLGYLR